MAKKNTKKSVQGRTKKPLSKGGWTTMYVPKEGVAAELEHLTQLVHADLPEGASMPKYKILQLALREAIEKRS